VRDQARYSEETKRAAVQRHVHGGVSIHAITRDIGATWKTVRRWVHAAGYEVREEASVVRERLAMARRAVLAEEAAEDGDPAPLRRVMSALAAGLGPSKIVVTLRLADDGMGELRLIVDAGDPADPSGPREQCSFEPGATSAWALRVLHLLAPIVTGGGRR